MRFAKEDAGPAEVNGILGMKLEKADLVHLAQTVLFGVIGIVALLVVLRPMVLRITAMAPSAIGSGGGAAVAALVGPGGAAMMTGAAQQMALAGPALIAAAPGRREHGEHLADRGADARVLAASDRRTGGKAPGRDPGNRARLDGAGERLRC